MWRMREEGNFHWPLAFEYTDKHIYEGIMHVNTYMNIHSYIHYTDINKHKNNKWEKNYHFPNHFSSHLSIEYINNDWNFK